MIDMFASRYSSILIFSIYNFSSNNHCFLQKSVSIVLELINIVQQTDNFQ